MNIRAQRMYAKRAADANTAVRAGVGVFVRDQRGWILLEKRSDSGMWGLPGGAIDPGESIHQAALREVKEEAGLEVRITKLIGVYSEPSQRIVVYPDNGDVRHLVDITLEAEIIAGELTISPESLELRFFPLDALPAEIAPPAVQPIKDYIQGLTGVMR